MDNLSTISNLYRFALVLTGSPSLAERLVGESMQELLYGGGGESARRMRWLLFRGVRQKALSQKSSVDSSLLSDVVQTLHMLAEPSRSAIVLLCLDCFSVTDFESLLDLSTQELAEALDAARSNLKRIPLPSKSKAGLLSAPNFGGLKQIKNILSVCPPTRNSGGDVRLKKALQAAQKDPQLSAFLDSQIQFDSYIAKNLKAVPSPTSLELSSEKAESVLSHQTVPTLSLRDPAIISVVVASILLVGLAIWLFLGKFSSFPGSTETWRVVSEGDNFNWDRLEPTVLKMDGLDDWFAMRGMDQFWAPSSFSKLNVIGGRVFTVADLPIAMGVVDHPRMLFYAFNGARFGILPPSDGHWKILTRERKAIGITRQGDAVFVIEIDGSQGDLQRILHHLASS